VQPNSLKELEAGALGYLIVASIRLMWLTLVLTVWLMWAAIALPIVLIASATGNHRAARQWQRSLRWRHVL
jgi:hypothetical protein